MKYILILALVLAIFASTQAKVQSGAVDGDYWASTFPEVTTKSYQVTFDSAFTEAPIVVLGTKRLDFLLPNSGPIYYEINASSITTTGFQVDITMQSSTNTFYQINVNYVAYTQTKQQYNAGSYGVSPSNGYVVDIPFNLECSNENVKAAALVTGINTPQYYFEWDLSVGSAVIESNVDNNISGHVPLTIYLPTYDGTLPALYFNYIIACGDDLYIDDQGTQAYSTYTYHSTQVDDFDASKSYGAIFNIDTLQIDTSINVRLLSGYYPSQSTTGQYTGYVGVWAGSYAYQLGLQVIVFTQSQCESTCDVCTEGVCTQCIEDYDFLNGECVSLSSFVYWYVNGYDYEKIIGSPIEGYTPGTGYFVWASEYCETTYNKNGVDILYESINGEGFWLWIEGDLTEVKTEGGENGYWVHDYTIDEEWYQPPYFDPENPEINWTTWAWLLEWILTYTETNYTEELDIEELTEMAEEQKYHYTNEEIEYVFNVIGNYDEGISYGDILTTIIEIYFGDYSNRIIGACE